MQYFGRVIEFVDEHLIWAVWIFLAAVAVELIVFLIRKRNRFYFETENLYIAVVSNVVALLGLYILACLGVGLVAYLKEQDYHFWTNYISFMTENIVGQILIFLAGLAGLIYFGFFTDVDGLVMRLITGSIGAALAVLALFIVGFVVYIVFAFVWLILKMVFFVILGCFYSLYQFTVKYWKWMLLVFLSPGVTYGAISSLVNYIISLKEEVIVKD